MGKAFRVLHPINPPVCLSMVSYESMPVNREESLSTPNKKKILQGQIFLHGSLLQNIFFQGWVEISGLSMVFFHGQRKSRSFRVFHGHQGLLARVDDYDDDDIIDRP